MLPSDVAFAALNLAYVSSIDSRSMRQFLLAQAEIFPRLAHALAECRSLRKLLGRR